MTKTIGIDLGTSRTCAAIVDAGRPRVLRSALGYTTIPSVVTFDDNGAPVVGHKAERQMTLHPENTIYGSKRLLGRAYLSGVKQYFQPHFAYQLVNLDGRVAANVHDQVVSLTEVASLILGAVRASAESALGEPVHKAIITVPAYFNDAQRNCVREAGKLANLEVLRTLNEPTAAALAFGTRQTERKKVLVYDLGGGTFDVSIVDIDAAVYEVLGVDGDTFLGGLDFDNALCKIVLDRASAENGQDLELNAQSKERLRDAVQQAKHRLSTESEAVVQLTHLELADGAAVDINEGLTREELNQATKPLVDRTLEIVTRALDAVELEPSDIDDLLLVGGQTRMPQLHQRLQEMFGRAPSKRVHPDEVVAIGAAIAAESLSKEGAPVLLDVLPLAIGLGHARDEFEIVVPKNTQVPTRATTGFVVPAGRTAHEILVYQGNSLRASENAYLGMLALSRLPKRDSNTAGELLFRIDNECMLTLQVTIASMGIEQSMRLSAQTPSAQEPDEADHHIDHVPVVERKVKAVDTSGGGTATAQRGWFSRLMIALRLSKPDANR